MYTFYEFIIARKWSGPIPTLLFSLGKWARELIFFIRNGLGSLLFSPPAMPKSISPTSIKRILVIRTDRIGDIVLAVPALNALKQKFPDTIIDLVVRESYASLLRCYPVFTNLITVNSVDDTQGIKKLGKELQNYDYDISIVMHPSQYAYTLAKTLGVPSIGWDAKGFGYSLSFAFNDDRTTARRHQVENNLKLLEPLGIQGTTPHFPTRQTDMGLQQYQQFSDKHGIVESDALLVIHPGSHNPRVRWETSKFAEVANYGAKNGYRVVVIATPHDAEALAAMRERLTSDHIVSTDDFNLEGLVSLFTQAKAFVGQSTGPMHIAVSCGCYTLACFGNEYPMDHYALWRPYGSKGRLISSKVECCKMPWTCPDMRCMKSIESNHVIDVLKEIGTPNE